MPGPSSVGHAAGFDISAAGDGSWITSDVRINDNVNNERAFGDERSLRTVSNAFVRGSRLREIAANGVILSTVDLRYVATSRPDASIDIESYGGQAWDLGANDKGAVWRIGIEASPGGYAIEQRSGTGWQRIPGAAVRIDVDPDGRPWVVNDGKRIYRWLGSQWLQLSGAASDIGIAADGTVWIVDATPGSEGRVRRLASVDAAGNAVWQATEVDLPPSVRAVAVSAGQQGEAWVATDAGEVWHAAAEAPAVAATFDPLRTRDIAAAGPLAIATSERQRADLALGDGGAVSLWFVSRAFDAADILRQAGDDPVAGPLLREMLAEGDLDADDLAELGIEAGKPAAGCLLSLSSSSARSGFNICLDETHSAIDLRIGGNRISAPVGPLDGRLQHLVLAVVPEGPDRDLTARLWLNGEARGAWPIDGGAGDTRPRAMLHVGEAAPGVDRFNGVIGTVRLWADAPEPAAIEAVPMLHEAAGPGLPGYENLVLEAVLAGPDDAQILLQPRSIVPERYWRSAEDDLFRPTLLPATAEAAKKVEANFAMTDVYRLRFEPPARPGLPRGLTIFKDSGASFTEARFVQTGRDSYAGTLSPVTGATGEVTATFAAQTVEDVVNGRATLASAVTLLIGDDRLFPVEPFPVSAAKVSISDSFAFENMARQIENNYHGHDVTKMDPRSAKSTASRAKKIFRLFTPQDFDNTDYTVQGSVVIPYGVNYYWIQEGRSTTVQTVIGSTREYHDSFGFSLGAAMEVPQVAAFSRNFEFNKSTEMMRETRRSASYSNIHYAFYALVADRSRLSLDREFRIAVDDVLKQRRTVQSLIDTFGTHYPYAVAYGQRARFQTLIDTRTWKEELSQAWKAGMKNSLTIKGVTVELDAAYEQERRRGAGGEREDTFSFKEVEGAPISTDDQEMTLGDDQKRVVPVAYDLRPLWQVLSPLYFDDPRIYVDMRRELGWALNRYTSEGANGLQLSDESFVPQVVRLTAEDVAVRSTGGGLYGRIGVDLVRDGQVLESHDLWSRGQGSAVAAEERAAGNPVVRLEAEPLDLVRPPADWAGVEIVVRSALGNTATTVPYNAASVRLAAGEVGATPLPRTLVNVPTSCRCLSACPAGFSASGTECQRDCPSGFETRGGTCYGSYPAETTFPAWDMGVCESQYAYGCEYVAETFAILPKCRPGFFRVTGTFGICIADCEAFGLDRWAGGNATCVRPSWTRASVPVNGSTGSCDPGYVPAESACPTAELRFTANTVGFN